MFNDLSKAPHVGAFFTMPGIITITGGGGKTSLLHSLLKTSRAGGLRAVGAVTTKTYLQDEHIKDLIFVSSEADCLRAVKKAGKSANGAPLLCSDIDPSDSRKVLGVPPEWLDAASRAEPDYMFIVEGDGSASKPLKGYLPHEPVIPCLTRLVLLVVGLDAVDQPLNDVVVHRPARFGELAGAFPEECIDAAMIAKALVHPDGYLRNIPPAAEMILLLNKAETLRAVRNALIICQELASRQAALRNVIIGSIHNECYGIRITR